MREEDSKASMSYTSKDTGRTIRLANSRLNRARSEPPGGVGAEDITAILDLVVQQVRRRAECRVFIPYECMRSTLEARRSGDDESSPDWRALIFAILDELASVKFECLGDGDIGEGTGALIGEWQFLPRASELHKKGVYMIDVQPGFLGASLLPTYPPTEPLDTARTFGFELSDTEQRPGNEELFSSNSFALFAGASGHSPEGLRLCVFLDNNLTLTSDWMLQRPGARGTVSETPSIFGPEIFDHSYCQLIPRGHTYIGVLGRSLRTQEPGFRLLTPGEGDSGELGLVQHMGLPETEAGVQRAVQALVHIIEESLEGFVATRIRDFWLHLSAARHLLPKQFNSQLRFHIFLPQNCFSRNLERRGVKSVFKSSRAEIKELLDTVMEPEDIVDDSPEIAAELADVIAATRAQKKDVAKQLGISPSMLSKILGGKKSIPQPRRYQIIAWIDDVKAKLGAQ